MAYTVRRCAGTSESEGERGPLTTQREVVKSRQDTLTTQDGQASPPDVKRPEEVSEARAKEAGKRS